MDRELRRLRSKIAATTRDRQGHRRFGEELRAELLSFARTRISDGATQAEVADELGIVSRVLWGWLRRDDAQLREVVVEAEPAPRRSSAARIVLRNGAEIVGLELDELITIARALS